MWVEKNLQGIAFTSGVFAHLLYFHKGEHHRYPLRIVYAYVGTYIAGAGILHYARGTSITASSIESIALSVIHLAGLYASLLVYRFLWHPLGRFPGPLWARASSWYMPSQIRHKPPFRVIDDLHRKYGDFVRIGSSEISVLHPQAMTVIHGFKSPCTKPPFYDMSYPLTSMHSFRSKQAHDQRRRIWNPGFTDTAVRGYEQRIRPYRRLFMNIIADVDDGTPLDITDCCIWYSYDVMRDLALGESYGSLQSRATVAGVQAFLDGSELQRYMFPAWFPRLFMTIPTLQAALMKFKSKILQDVLQRMKLEPDIPDIFAYFLAPLQGRDPTSEDLQRLQADVELLIGAGGDTTSMTLSVCIYELARRPEHVQKLRDELSGCDRDLSGEYLHEKVSGLQHLNGFINEVQRVHSSVPTQLARMTPPEGVHIGGTYVPGGTTVYCSQWAICRSAAVFERPEEFLPERWYRHPEMIKDKSAFSPFATGPYGCIGKSLALMNLRTTLAQLVMTYDLELPPGDDGTFLDRHLDEHFSIHIDKLYVSFRPRTL